MVGVVQCDRGEKVVKGMEEPSFCNLSLAVDCTLSLGSTTTRTENPARLSDHDLDWSLAVRSAHCEPEQDNLSWGGSCNRSDSDVSPGYYPQVSERGTQGDRRGFKAWRQSCNMIEDHHNRASRQPWSLSSYLPSVEAKGEQCILEGDGFARVCAHCGTSKTPLWRNGPGGPKSLCNACGIRFKKAGRRSAANGGSDSQVSPPVTSKVVKRKLNDERQYWVYPADVKGRKRSWQSSLVAYDLLKRRDFLSSPSEEVKLNLELGSFSSDEEEGAVLLMALSCGMVNA